MTYPFKGIHSGIVLVHEDGREWPVRLAGNSQWGHVPAVEEYARGMITAFVQDHPEMLGRDIRVVELNFSIIESGEIEDEPDHRE